MANTLYVTDLDGTLLNNGGFVSPASAEILADLSDQGALITVATARTPATVVPLMEGTATTVPYVVMTGASLYDPVRHRYIDRSIIPADDCRVLYSLFDSAGVNPFVYHFAADDTLVVYHDRKMNDSEREFYEARAHLRLKRFTFEPLADPTEAATLFFATGDGKVIRDLAAQIHQTGRFSVSCYPDIFSPETYMLEVFINGVSKASAIKRLAAAIDARRIVAFGDNLNDLPMFEVADLAVAVANAHPRVKAVADIVIGPNFDDSVPRFIADDLLTHH